jgi:hypothetical protein
MTPIEYRIVRDTFKVATEGREGYTLGQLFQAGDSERICYTLEDQDRHLEDGNGKLYGKTAMPLGRFELELYNSPKHGTVPLFQRVPGFSFTEMHRANHAEELLGCVAVGDERTSDGVCKCQPALNRVVAEMRQAKEDGRQVFCTISRQS